MVYRSDCRYLPYSIPFFEFMAIFSRENGQNTRLFEVRHFSMIENGRRRLLGAQSINSESSSNPVGVTGRNNAKRMRELSTRVVYLRVVNKIITKTVYKWKWSLQIEPRKKSEAPTGFEPVTSAIPVRCSTNWAMKPRWKQVRCEFNLYPLYEENDMCIW